MNVKKTLDFNDPKARDGALSNFRELLKHPGWQLLEQIVEENMAVIKDQIVLGTGDNETLDTIARLRDRYKAYGDIINTPRQMIEKLEPVDNGQDDIDDPYFKVDKKD